ncbi:sugar ABC transporter substrate-binding protein [Alicyclobacillus fastidiosus]|uniref:Sugar ABC transporter substrate-binding protein n=1 Tax=Alicyclobacillus fastidiosus TaxID=392011 RepID=A0ABY6ZAB5_9BACL|nr:sugar ABC transporter substrate-binding protein [Alicyclobacillus fastidiosus]WAH39825.1 sugar ABC transporter substrate-binding protein [Alicyclobacillus fastidiosus]GMA61082.1 sugar transporter [Alicyclobacillus fastidiosus]
MKYVKTAGWATSILLAGTVTLVNGCGTSSGSGGGGSNSSGKKITLTLMDYYTSGQGDTEMNTLISEYEKENSNVTINRTSVPGGSYQQKVLQEATANSLPDVLMLDNPMVPDIASTGVLVPLTTLGHIDTNNFPKGSLSEGLYNNSLYALPNGNNTIGLFYNKKMFQQAGIKQPPQTWAQLVTDAKKLTNGSTYGFAFSGASGIGNVAWQTEPFFWTDGGDLKNNIDSAGTKNTLNLLLTMEKDGSMPQDVVNWNQQDVQNQFQEGKVAMVINGPWIVPSLQQIRGLSYGISTIPVPKVGDTVVSPLGGEVWTVTKQNSSTEQAAFKFIQWLADTKQNQIAWNTANQTIPAYTPAMDAVVSKYPYLKTFETEVKTARARTADLGTNYPNAVNIWGTALQSVLTGKASVDQALATAKSATQQMLSSSSQ